MGNVWHYRGFHNRDILQNPDYLKHPGDSGHRSAWQRVWGEVAMLRRQLYLHYRLIREAITVVVTIGTALLFSYLILRVRL